MGVGGEDDEGVLGVEVGDEGEEFGGPAGEGDEEDNVVGVYLAEVAVERFGGVEECGADGETVHCCHELVGDVSALAHSHDHQLPSLLHGSPYQLHRIIEPLPCDRVCLV